MTHRHALLETLQANGVALITGSPGTEWVVVLDALAEARANGEPVPRYVNCRHETVAVAIAHGYGRYTGKVAAVLLHSAVGPLHAAMAIRAAYHAKSPLLLLGGDALTSDHDAIGNSGWIWVSRLADTQSSSSFVKDYVKWSTQATVPATMSDAVARGAAIARELPWGPAYVGLPCSLLLSEMAASHQPPVVGPSQAPPPPDMTALARALAEARHPIIISEYAGRTGAGVHALTDLAEALAAPVYDGVDPFYVNIEPAHPLYQGRCPEAALKAADVILLTGVTTPWFPPAAPVAPDCNVILIDDDVLKTRLPFWDYRTKTRVPGDIEANLSALNEAVKATLKGADAEAGARTTRRGTLAVSHQEMTAGWQRQAGAEKSSRTLAASDFLIRLRDALPGDAIVVDDAISQSGLVRRYLGDPESYLKVGSGGLGIGMAYAAGVKLAAPERPVVYIVGDGTFTYNPVLATLGACQEYGLPLLTVVLNNGGYGAIRGGLRRYRPDGWAVKHDDYLGADFTPLPEYAALAAAYGAQGYRVARPEEMDKTLPQAFAKLAAGQSVIIDAVVD